MKRFLLVFVALAVILTAAALILQALGPRFQSALLLDVTCRPPCWLGITPGETSQWGVTSALLEAGFVEQPSIDVWERAGLPTRVMWQFRRPAGDLAGTAEVREDTVYELQVFTAGSLSLEQAIELLGEPDSYGWETARASAEGEVELAIVFSTSQAIVRVRLPFAGAPQSDGPAIGADTPVRSVSYLSQAAFANALASQDLTLIGWEGISQIEPPN